MALGARNTDIGGMILGEAGKLVGAGLLIGAALAVGASSAMGSLLYGVGARDPLTFVTVSLVVCLVAVAAALVPAVRAARADPLLSMRAE
jgi:ABC-type antimicrobial peptide transport system permease subunit